MVAGFGWCELSRHNSLFNPANNPAKWTAARDANKALMDLGGRVIRDMAVLKFKSASDKIIVSGNNDATAIFECTMAAEETVAVTQNDKNLIIR